MITPAATPAESISMSSGAHALPGTNIWCISSVMEYIAPAAQAHKLYFIADALPSALSLLARALLQPLILLLLLRALLQPLILLLLLRALLLLPCAILLLPSALFLQSSAFFCRHIPSIIYSVKWAIFLTSTERMFGSIPVISWSMFTSNPLSAPERSPGSADCRNMNAITATVIAMCILVFVRTVSRFHVWLLVCDSEHGITTVQWVSQRSIEHQQILT